MKKFYAAGAVVAAAVLGTGVAASASSSLGPLSKVGSPGAVVAGHFNAKHVVGISNFLQSADGGTVYVNGVYSQLDKNRAYFTVAYGNKNCDPAQAFPVGPFTSNSKGKARLAAGVPNTGPSIAGSGSVSVRFGDTDKKGNPTDQDGDGLTGPTDVVAVPGKPSIGLVKCDSHPFTLTP